jgi:Predicted O-methyltransferase
MLFKTNKLMEYAARHRVPILHPESVEALKTIVKSHQPQRVLEVGTAIGYSAMHIASVDDSIHVTTLERDPNMVNLANKFIESHGFANQITVVSTDAATFELPFPVDLIFIDAGKAQYQVMFERFAPQLNEGGLIVCDNYYMHGLTMANAPKSKRTMARKLEEFKSFLSKHPNFDTSIVEVGDGLSVSRKQASA